MGVQSILIPSYSHSIWDGKQTEEREVRCLGLCAAESLLSARLIIPACLITAPAAPAGAFPMEPSVLGCSSPHPVQSSTRCCPAAFPSSAWLWSCPGAHRASSTHCCPAAFPSLAWPWSCSAWPWSCPGTHRAGPGQGMLIPLIPPLGYPSSSPTRDQPHRTVNKQWKGKGWLEQLLENQWEVKRAEPQVQDVHSSTLGELICLE